MIKRALLSLPMLLGGAVVAHAQFPQYPQRPQDPPQNAQALSLLNILGQTLTYNFQTGKMDVVTGQPNEGIAYELDAVAAAVIGGTSLIGGIGTISGTAIGSFIIGILRNGLNMNGVSAFTQQILIGLVILFTVWIDQLRNRH